ncbi:YibL family ribosome-associated protein [Parashewanella curva]|uniref:YibL family ribosome-associated protein n=1 Tax=Parashewanella curva TaxID=2338552 RepID=A0A3L8Q0T9_9GAMM|nr:YibL family ribosome-associated protein [Parashewanella curva]RLV60428.1 YibL family ribosome-associated protein [Parashewanella curva]
MNLKQELQTLNNKLDKSRRKLSAAQARGDEKVQLQFKQEIAALTKRITAVKSQQQRQLNNKGSKIQNLPFNRTLSKAEQADLGKLKKTVKGLVVVHPMTALGREMGINSITGFAPKEF